VQPFILMPWPLFWGWSQESAEAWQVICFSAYRLERGLYAVAALFGSVIVVLGQFAQLSPWPLARSPPLGPRAHRKPPLEVPSFGQLYSGIANGTRLENAPSVCLPATSDIVRFGCYPAVGVDRKASIAPAVYTVVRPAIAYIDRLARCFCLCSHAVQTSIQT
jgi:hypothetical protein